MDGKINEIIWTNEAVNDLRFIYDFYFNTASKQIAQNIINKIQTKVDALYLSAYIGQTEPLLEHLDLGVRYLVEGNYKIFTTILTISRMCYSFLIAVKIQKKFNIFLNRKM